MIFRPHKFGKLLFIFFLFLIIIGGGIFIFVKDFSSGEEVEHGVTFSQKYAEELELDWRRTYLAILNDLNVDHIRLATYWDEIEAVPGEFDFSDLDWQISEAAKRDVSIILVLGRRTPRWPECHDPGWLKILNLEEVRQKQLDFVHQSVVRYRHEKAIRYWQVENEPLFKWFGKCPDPDKDFLKQEIDLVRSLDDRKIIITDSGEINHWQGAASLADILGVTLYRVVWNPYLGFWDYFFVPPAYYRYKADITKFFHDNLEEVIVIELQMEPWTTGRKMIELSLEEQQKSFDLKRFKGNISYVQRAGFSEVYSWGVEYWYWLKEQGHPEIWNEAKKLW